MGLDTYAYHTNSEGKRETMPDELFSEVGSLCGGLFSGGGASFRGKVYAGFLHNSIGLDLYQDEIRTETVARAADALDALLLETPGLEYSDISNGEIRALAKWFRVVASGGGTVVGWW